MSECSVSGAVAPVRSLAGRVYAEGSFLRRVADESTKAESVTAVGVGAAGNLTGEALPVADHVCNAGGAINAGAGADVVLGHVVRITTAVAGNTNASADVVTSWLVALELHERTGLRLCARGEGDPLLISGAARREVRVEVIVVPADSACGEGWGT